MAVPASAAAAALALAAAVARSSSVLGAPPKACGSGVKIPLPGAPGVRLCISLLTLVTAASSCEVSAPKTTLISSATVRPRFLEPLEQVRQTFIDHELTPLHLHVNELELVGDRRRQRPQDFLQRHSS